MIELSGAISKKISAKVGDKLYDCINSQTNNVILATCRAGTCRKCSVMMSGKKVLSCLTKVPAFEGVLPIVVPPQVAPVKKK